MVTCDVPAIRARRKAQCSELDDARAIVRACELLGPTPVWVPVWYGGRVIAEIRGDRQNRRSLIHPVYRATGLPYKNYDDAVKNLTLEYHWSGYSVKMTPNTTNIDNWYDLWGTDGVPSKGDWSGTAFTSRQFTKSTVGAMFTGPNVSTKTKYLTRFSSMAPEATSLSSILYDRVLSYDACTMANGTNTMTNTLAATRYISTGDPGLQLFIEADSAQNATGSNLTGLSYTNQAGTAGQNVTTTPTLARITSLAAPTSSLGARCSVQLPGATAKSIMYVPLAAGDTGIRSIQSQTWSAAPTGTNSLVLQFPLMLFIGEGSAIGTIHDYSFIGGIEAAGKRIYDDACLSLMANPHTASQASQLNCWMETGWS